MKICTVRIERRLLRYRSPLPTATAPVGGRGPQRGSRASWVSTGRTCVACLRISAGLAAQASPLAFKIANAFYLMFLFSIA